MGKGFKNVKASFIGSVSQSDKIPQWLKANGGQYSRDVDDSVTHLIATESAFENNVDVVKKAKSLNIKIVTYDWLEDSLLSKGSKPKREGPYLIDRILKERGGKNKVTKVSKKSETKQTPQKKRKKIDPEKLLGEFQQNARVVVSEMGKLGYHLYVDESTGASYSATLVQYSPINNRRKETWLAKVYESNDTPHKYTTFVRNTRVGGMPSAFTLAPRGSTLDSALFVFKKFFFVKTGINWMDRFDDRKVPGTSTTANEQAPALPEGGWFRFERPDGLMAALNIDAEKAIGREVEQGNDPEEVNTEDGGN